MWSQYMSTLSHGATMQAAQVRKVSYVPDETAEYDPDRHSSNTIYAGTTVAQAGPYAHCLTAPSERFFRTAVH